VSRYGSKKGDFWCILTLRYHQNDAHELSDPRWRIRWVNKEQYARPCALCTYQQSTKASCGRIPSERYPCSSSIGSTPQVIPTPSTRRTFASSLSRLKRAQKENESTIWHKKFWTQQSLVVSQSSGDIKPEVSVCALRALRLCLPPPSLTGFIGPYRLHHPIG